MDEQNERNIVPTAEEPQGEDRSGTERLKALADGLFAIVLTLLVLELKLPELGEGKKVTDHDVLNLLLDSKGLGFTVFMYVVTFLIAGIYWYNHLLVMRRLRKTDEAMIWLNLLFFLFVSLLPFTSSLFTSVEGHGSINVLLIYSGNNLLAGIALLIIWFYVSSRRRLLDHKVADYEVNIVTTKIAVLPFTAFLSLVFALLIDPFWGLAMYYISPFVLSTAQGFYAGRLKRLHGEA